MAKRAADRTLHAAQHAEGEGRRQPSAASTWPRSSAPKRRWTSSRWNSRTGSATTSSGSRRRASVSPRTSDQDARAALFRAGHDIKGQAATFEFPLIARVATSLCKLIDALDAPDSIPLGLIDAHVAAIRIIFRDKIKDPSNRMAMELCEELEARVTEALQLAA